MATISIVAPCYNEAAAVEPFVVEIDHFFRRELADHQLQIVLVDDGSTDGTLAAMLRVQERYPAITVVELSRNFGKEAALSAGLAAAVGDAVIPMDADLQDPPSLIPEMVALWRSGYDVVVARRTDRSSDSLAKRTSARMFYRLFNWLSTVKIPHDVGDFRLMDRAVVEVLGQLDEQQRMMKGIFAWAGFRTAEVTYARVPRTTGETKFSPKRLVRLAVDGLLSFSTAPLRLAVYLGVLAAAVSAVYAAWLVGRTVLYGVDVPGYASTMVVVLVLGSVQLLSVGLLGEYVGRMYHEVKRRPPYVVRKVYEGEG